MLATRMRMAAAGATGGAGNGLLNALIAYWPGNEASGNLQDAHSNALHLTDTNSVTNAVGKVYATARQYTAANSEYHTRNSAALLQIGDVDFTLAAWVWLEDKSTIRRIVTKDDEATERSYILTYQNVRDVFNFVVFLPTGAASIDSAITPALSTWYFVVAWHDAENDLLHMQINNGADVSVATGGALKIDTTTSSFRIGSHNSASVRFWDGRIGPVAMWKSVAGGGGVLTADQRTALYNGGLGLTYAEFTT